MNIFFSVSSKENIDPKLFIDAREISEAAALAGYDLIIGAAMDKGMPKEVLDSFKKHGRNITLKTLKVYGEDPKVFNYVHFDYCEDTFDRTKEIYHDSDILLVMPGGTGTAAEIFGFLEQLRTDLSHKLMVVYNKDNHYQGLLNCIQDYVSKNFNSESIYDFIHVYSDKDELTSFLSFYIKK